MWEMGNTYLRETKRVSTPKPTTWRTGFGNPRFYPLTWRRQAPTRTRTRIAFRQFFYRAWGRRGRARWGCKKKGSVSSVLTYIAMYWTMAWSTVRVIGLNSHQR